MQHIFIGNDHAGTDYAKKLCVFLQEKGFDAVHLGTFDENSVDYPDFGKLVGNEVMKNIEKNAKGIVICGTGIGISIAANKVEGIRAANCTSVEMAEMARKHNDANILGLGARILSFEEAQNITEVFLATDFEGGRHACRVAKIENLSYK